MIALASCRQLANQPSLRFGTKSTSRGCKVLSAIQACVTSAGPIARKALPGETQLFVAELGKAIEVWGSSLGEARRLLTTEPGAARATSSSCLLREPFAP
eukprot:5541371-Amphidinium_carterae.1